LFAVPAFLVNLSAAWVVAVLSLVFQGSVIVAAIVGGVMGLAAIKKSQGQSGGKGLAIAGIATAAASLLVYAGGGLVVAMMAVGKDAVRQEAKRIESSSNLRQIGIALHNYHDTFGAFPTDANTRTNPQNKLSWRVHILPFIEQDALYRQFKLDEPWDSPN